jgi:glycyl-tRNA synthetase
MPHVIEPTFGLDRTILALLVSAYREEGEGDDARVYLAFDPKIAPNKICVSPLLKNKPELVAKSEEVFTSLKKAFGDVVFDDNGNIGKRYRRQDEIGTPFCVVVDFDTLEKDDSVSIRHRDDGSQERVKIADLEAYFRKALA